jgi:hypothetical protein
LEWSDKPFVRVNFAVTPKSHNAKREKEGKKTISRDSHSHGMATKYMNGAKEVLKDHTKHHRG